MRLNLIVTALLPFRVFFLFHCFLSLLWLVSGVQFAQAQSSNTAAEQTSEPGNVTPLAIMERLDTLYRTNASRARVTVEIVNKRYQRQIEMNIVTLGEDYSLITITSPRKERGVTTLKRKTEIWNYLPKIRRKVRLPPSMMSESWMGSDLTNDDLVREVSWKLGYSHKIDKSSANGAQTCVSSVPQEDVPVAWSRVITCVDSVTALPERQDFYDEKKTRPTREFW